MPSLPCPKCKSRRTVYLGVEDDGRKVYGCDACGFAFNNEDVISR